MSGDRDYGLQPGATNHRAARTIAAERDWNKPKKEPEPKEYEAFKAAKELNKPAQKFLNKVLTKDEPAKLTDKDYEELGARWRQTPDNVFLQCWAAESIDESYPMNAAQTKIIMGMHSDLELGKRVSKWIDKNKKANEGKVKPYFGRRDPSPF